MVLVTSATFSTACSATCTVKPTTSSAPSDRGVDGKVMPSASSSSTNSPTTAQAPHKAQLLADDGKDKIVLRLGHEQMLLPAVAQPQPRGPCRT